MLAAEKRFDTFDCFFAAAGRRDSDVLVDLDEPREHLQAEDVVIHDQDIDGAVVVGLSLAGSLARVDNFRLLSRAPLAIAVLARPRVKV